MTTLVAAGLVVSGCATGRLEKTRFGTTNERFSVARDLVIIRGNNGDKTNRDDQIRRNAKDTSAGNIVTLLHDYYATSEYVREMEFDSLGANRLGKPKLPDAQTDPQYAKALLAYRAAGFNASRSVCRYALNLLGESHSDYKFLNRSVNVLAGGGASLMGILDASARTTSLYAVGTALYQAWSQDFEEYAYLTASIGTIGKKVAAAQETYREGIEYGAPKGATILSPQSWSEATVQIQRYNDFCLATGMRALVEEAVGKADVYFDPERKDVEIIGTATNEVRRAVERGRQEQRALQELTVQIDRRWNEQTELNRGLREVELANDVLADASPSPFYDLGANPKTVDVALAEREVATKKSLLDAATTNNTGLEEADANYQKALRAAADARRVEAALQAIKKYDAAWVAARQQAISEAEAAAKKLRAELGEAQPAPAPQVAAAEKK